MSDHPRVPEPWQAFLREEGAELSESGVASFRDEPETGSLIAPLAELDCITIEGEDAVEFLDGQLSAAIRKLSSGEAVLTAWHDPKGRVLVTLLLMPRDGGFDCLMPASLSDTLLPRLKMYVLRSRVTLTRRRGEHVALGRLDEGETPRGDWQTLTGEARFRYWCGPADRGRELWRTARDEGASPAGDETWRRAEMRAGIPRVGAATSGLFLPQFLDLERFGGLDFKKGCYTGQEVIARTHYLGKVKQGLALAHSDRACEPADAVRDENGKRIGQVLDARRTPGGEWLVQVVTRETDGKLSLDDGDNTPLRMVT